MSPVSNDAEVRALYEAKVERFLAALEEAGREDTSDGAILAICRQFEKLVMAERERCASIVLRSETLAEAHARISGGDDA